MNKKLSYDYYGLTVVEVNGREYAVGSNSKADKAVKENIRDSVWSFNKGFILRHSALKNHDAIDVIEALVAKCEDANEPLLKLIPDFDAFVEDAVSSDGRGHFLSSYDGEENTLDEIDEDDAKEIAKLLKIRKNKYSTTYVYRTN